MCGVGRMDKARRCTLRALVALVLCGACLNRLCKNGSNPTVPTISPIRLAGLWHLSYKQKQPGFESLIGDY